LISSGTIKQEPLVNLKSVAQPMLRPAKEDQLPHL